MNKIGKNKKGTTLKRVSSNLNINTPNFWEINIQRVLIILVICIPLAIFPLNVNSFEPIKLLIAEILTVIMLMLWGLNWLAQKPEKRRIRPSYSLPSFFIFSFMAVGILSLLWSESLGVSIKELPVFLLGPVLYFIIINNIKDKISVKKIIDVIIFVGAFLGVYGIFQYFGLDFSFWQGNRARQMVFGLFGNVNYFAEYLIAVLPLTVSLFFVTSIKSNKSKKILLLIGILAMSGSLLLTFTRSSYLGFGVSLIFMFLLFIICRGKTFIRENKKIFILILATILLIGFLFVIPNPLSKEGTYISKIKARTSITALTEGHSFKRRLATWKFTLMMIEDHPLLGSGIGTFEYNSLRYQAEFFEKGDNRSIYPHGFARKAHNEYLQLWAEMGIIGLGIFLGIMICFFYYSITQLKKLQDDFLGQGLIIGMMGTILAILVDGIFGFPLHLPATVVLFWLYLGFTFVLLPKEERRVIERDKISQKKKYSLLIKIKPVLYLLIIMVTIFLCIHLFRPFIANIYWYYGNNEIKNGNVDKAIELYHQSIEYDPYLSGAYYALGEIALNIEKDFDLAENYYKKAERYADYPNLPQHFAAIYVRKKEFSQAIPRIIQAISYQGKEEKKVGLYSSLGNAYLAVNDDKKAENAFQNALEIDPNSVDAHYWLARMYLDQKKEEQALFHLEQIVSIAPESTKAKLSQGIIRKIKNEDKLEE